MRILLLVSLWFLSTGVSVQGQQAPDARELTRLLNEFLVGASRNDPAAHERFWADDLIYTRSAGRPTSKSEILRSVRTAPAPKPADPITHYSAEDIRIQQYGDTAIVAFRLVGKTEREGRIEVSNNLNTGTFLRRNGEWRVVAWQSTRMARDEETDKKELAVAEAAFHTAVLAADAKRLEAITDQNFVWTREDGGHITREVLLKEIAAGVLKLSKHQTRNVMLSVSGDTGLARGEIETLRSTAARSGGSSKTRPYTLHYTMTFAYRDGTWKAVSLHTSG